MMLRSSILLPQEGAAVAVERPEAAGPVLLVCEHAAKRLPLSAGSLGLSDEALDSHIAYDPGALDLSLALSAQLDACLIHQRFSRLVYDCNRPPEAPGAMAQRSEIYEIPGNCNLSDAERYARMAALYVPFHDRISAEIEARRARGQATVLVTVHSFTPVYFGADRAVEIGILHDADARLADAMLREAADGPFKVERNQPYGPEDGVTHTLRLHALPGGYANVMIEVRNDLISNSLSQEVMADTLAGLIVRALTRIG